MHSYLDPFVIRIAVIFGPQRDQDWSHIWTFSKPRLQSYMDPIKTKIAVIFGSQHVRYCNHSWTSLYGGNDFWAELERLAWNALFKIIHSNLGMGSKASIIASCVHYCVHYSKSPTNIKYSIKNGNCDSDSLSATLRFILS